MSEFYLEGNMILTNLGSC